MRPIALARVRLHGTGHNICGVSAQVFVAAQSAARGDQTQGVVDHITLLDDGVLLFEREGKRPELVPLHGVASMLPVEDMSAERLGVEYLAERAEKMARRDAQLAEVAAERHQKLMEVLANKPAVDDESQRETGEDLEVAHNHPEPGATPGPAPIDEEVPEWKRLGRQKPGPKPKGHR